MNGEWSKSAMNRRSFLLVAVSSGLLTHALPVEAATTQIFYRSPGCGCCHIWAQKMNTAGLPVTLEDTANLSSVSDSLGVPVDLQGCHVGQIGGYVISGHVPPEDIKRLMQEKPNARGILVAGMPVGSPGMEMGEEIKPYDVLLLMTDGTTKVFASYG
jgi:hypothetical protein